ncbi:hypothetical protein BJ138DRAFT_1009494 [Hygrophoropsis aurantiaca]|uniref:Uncharacterized protein n=1 Tax=Hygrophoropsis aurantiaca TaxID=72124 RepID=A0ACB8AA07_9AGAM|nr:hypothetical protein BJ138DRAFT_1009494 [Hygrophoropsis aurantiaca]
MLLTKSPFSNADVTDGILSSLPDFNTLHSAILTSKSIYTVFHDRPHSTIRAVAFNQIGPALPQALRLVRCERANLWLRPVDELLGEDELLKHPVITSEEVRMLVEKVKVADALEDLFSCRYKDKRFPNSQLTAVESARFHSAMYRLWLFTSIYGCQGRDDDDEIDVEAMRLIETKYFASLTTTQLREVERVVTFLIRLSNSSEHTYESHYDIDNFSPQFSLFNGPHAVLKAHLGDTSWVNSDDIENFDSMGIPDDWLTAVISAVLLDRNQREQAEKILLDEVIGEDDRCISVGPEKYADCTSYFVRDLINLLDWYFTSEIFEPLGMIPRLKSRLQLNVFENGEFRTACKSMTYPALLDEVFEYKTDSYSQWDKNDWLCKSCLEKFVTDHLHLWYGAKWQQQTQTIRDDCWYGYNCRTQTHNMVHAKKLNHWCEPTKGDA